MTLKEVQVDVIDLLIKVLGEHEKTLDLMVGNLTVAVDDLYKILDRLREREDAMLKYYEPIKGEEHGKVSVQRNSLRR